MSELWDEDEIVAYIRTEIDDAGSRRKFCEKVQISQQHLCDILKRRRRPPEAILGVLGFRKVVFYEPINS